MCRECSFRRFSDEMFTEGDLIACGQLFTHACLGVGFTGGFHAWLVKRLGFIVSSDDLIPN
jgi:hypothetical protein